MLIKYRPKIFVYSDSIGIWSRMGIFIILCLLAMANNSHLLASSKIEKAKQGCNKGNANACLAWGNILAEAPPPKAPTTDKILRVVEKTGKLFEKACDRGDPEACYTAGSIYIGDEIVREDYSPDYVKARRVLKKACDGGKMEGCSSLGLMYETGMGGKENRSLADELYKKACEGGVKSAC